MITTLEQKFRGIVDGYYDGSSDFNILVEVLNELDFLYSRGMIEQVKLGRLQTILNRAYEE